MYIHLKVTSHFTKFRYMSHVSAVSYKMHKNSCHHTWDSHHGSSLVYLDLLLWCLEKMTKKKHIPSKKKWWENGDESVESVKKHIKKQTKVKGTLW